MEEDKRSKFRKYISRLRHKYTYLYKLNKRSPVFVYQMGKVGSQSIDFSLRNFYKGEILHGHAMYPNDKSIENRLFYNYCVIEKKPVKIITLAREPVGKNVSHFFQEFEQHTGKPFSDSAFSIEELKSIFLNTPSVRHTEPLTWFDDNILKNFDIDIFKESFPKEKGSIIINKGNVDILLMKSEITDEQKELLISSFLNLKEFKITRQNVGDEKKYMKTYSLFKREVKFESAYLDMLYLSKYARHFYTDEEIKKARSQWEV